MNETLMRPPHRCGSQSAAPRAAAVPTPAVTGAATTSAAAAPTATAPPCCLARFVTDGDAELAFTERAVVGVVTATDATADVVVSPGATAPTAVPAGACGLAAVLPPGRTTTAPTTS